MPDLSFAMNLPPEKALEYFRGKENAKDKGWNWQEVWQEEHAKTFTVAKCVKADILQDLRTALDQAMAKGETFEQFRKNLEPTLKAKGWWGKQIAVDKEGNASTIQLGSPYRLRNIYRTNLQTAYMAGRRWTKSKTGPIGSMWRFETPAPAPRTWRWTAEYIGGTIPSGGTSTRPTTGAAAAEFGRWTSAA